MERSSEEEIVKTCLRLLKLKFIYPSLLHLRIPIRLVLAEQRSEETTVRNGKLMVLLKVAFMTPKLGLPSVTPAQIHGPCGLSLCMWKKDFLFILCRITEPSAQCPSD
jgi:hypothetical protein